MKRLFFILICLLNTYLVAFGGNDTGLSYTQYPKLSLREVNKRFVSDWVINGVDAVVFLETAARNIYITEQFIDQHNDKLGFALNIPSEDIAYGTSAGNGRRYKMPYIISDTMLINGTKRYRKNVIVKNKSETGLFYDIMYPIQFNGGITELNFKGGYMRVMKQMPILDSGFVSSIFQFEGYIPSIETKLTSSSGDTSASLEGRFVLDMGSANGIVLNKGSERIDGFIDHLHPAVLDPSVIKDDKGFSNR